MVEGWRHSGRRQVRDRCKQRLGSSLPRFAKITLDNLPRLGTDAGTGKTIKVWFGDQIKNGTTQTSVSIERGFLGQTTPTYIVNTGMVVDQLTTTITSKRQDHRHCSRSWVWAAASPPQPLTLTPDPVTTNLVMAANANVGRLGVNGSQLVGPNWSKEITFVVANNNFAPLSRLTPLRRLPFAKASARSPAKCPPISVPIPNWRRSMRYDAADQVAA
jgi:hypothetical protein